MMKIALLCLLLVPLHSDAIMGAGCRPLRYIENEAPHEVMEPGMSVRLPANERTRSRNACDNSSYVLVYQNQQGGESQFVYQKRYRIKTPPIYMNTSGIYCVYKNCTGAQMDECCIKVTAPTKMRILFPEIPQQNTREFGSCIVSAWPRPPKDDTTVFTNNPMCEINTLSVHYIDTYTTAVYFTVYVNSSCEYIACFTPSEQKQKSINTSHFTNTASPTHTQTPPPTPTQTPTLTTEDTTTSPTAQIGQHCGGALGMYSITLWTIVFALFSTVIT